MGYIYKITNKINNKSYIGKTTKTIEERWKEHLDESFNNSYYLIHKAIRKYGVKNFTIDQIEECSNDILSQREQYWIKVLNTYYKNNYGYNMTLGGEGALKYSDKDILKYWNQGLKSYQIADKLGANVGTISDRLKILKPGEARARHLNSNKKSILQYDLDGNFIQEWESANLAEKELKISSGSITRCCKKERTMANNYLWKYSTDDTPIEALMITYAKSNKCNGVDLIDKNGIILEQFETAAQAEREKGVTRGKVSEVCNHKRNTAGKLYWQWSYPLKRQLLNI